MDCCIDHKSLRALLYALNRAGRSITDGLFVSQSGIQKIKELIQSGEQVVLLPYFRTYTDVLVLLLALYAHEIPIPFTIGNWEDTPRNKLTDSLLRRVGYILASRSREQSVQEYYVN